MSEQEAAATGILALRIESASAKVRTGGPVDLAADYDLPLWAGVVPLLKTCGTPEADALTKESHPLPESIIRLVGDGIFSRDSTKLPPPR